jgi:hypothetical protein
MTDEDTRSSAKKMRHARPIAPAIAVASLVILGDQIGVVVTVASDDKRHDVPSI